VLISKIYKELSKLNNKNLNNLTIDLNRQLSKENVQIAKVQWVHEKMPNITNDQGNANQNHNEMLLHPTQVRMANLKNTNINM
jgi:hypothetical protein